jgi:hypothetical protein
MQCKFLKLTNGEDVIAMVSDDYLPGATISFIQIQDPVLIRSARFPRGNMVIETYIMQPWIKISKSNIMVIPTSSILTAVDITDSAVEQYNEFLQMKHDQEFQESQEASPEALSESDILQQLMEAVSARDELYDEEEEDDGATRTYH